MRADAPTTSEQGPGRTAGHPSTAALRRPSCEAARASAGENSRSVGQTRKVQSPAVVSCGLLDAGEICTTGSPGTLSLDAEL